MKRLLIAAAMLLAGCNLQVVSEGDRVGVVTKLSHKNTSGNCWSWEGEMSMAGGTRAGGQTDESNNPTSIWAFSVLEDKDKDRTIESLRHAMLAGTPTRLTYRQFNQYPGCAATEYAVTDVVELGRGHE